MSFSGAVKRELADIMPSTVHCRAAQLAAVLGLTGEIGFGPGGRMMLMMTSENRCIVHSAAALITRITGAKPEVSVTAGRERKGRTYLLAVTDRECTAKILRSTGYLNSRGVLRDFSLPPADAVIKKGCCRKAYIRGALMAAGSMSDPAKSYHLEFICRSAEKAEAVRDILASFGIVSKVMTRKQSDIVYIKGSDGIADTLNLAGAHRCLLDMENIRVLRGISGNVNRKVNCETANLGKTIEASVEQIRSIEKIRDTKGFAFLAPALRQAAEARLENPDLSLKDLGALLSPPVGKSGMNHRLRKLKQIADEL